MRLATPVIAINNVDRCSDYAGDFRRSVRNKKFVSSNDQIKIIEMINIRKILIQSNE
jgi:hypothetical protein